MKPSKSLFTHAGVFAVGIAVAMVVRQAESGPGSTSETRENGRKSSAYQGSSGESSDPSSSASRERREAAERGGKSAKSEQTAGAKLAGIVHMGDPLDRQAALMELVSTLAPDQFAEMAEQYRLMDHFGNSRGEFDIILRGWAKADPLGALEYTTANPNSRETSSVVLSAWAGKDAAAAERWALEHHEGDGPNPWLTSVIRGIATYDLQHASKLAASMPNSRERGEAMDAITRALFVQGADAAKAYPETIEDPALRTGYVAMIAERLASKDAEQAATWLASMNDPDAQTRGARRVAEALSRENITDAAAWVKKLSPQAQAEAARGVILPMSSGDIPGTAKWVSTLSGIPNYDRVVEEFVWSCDQRAPEQSAAWIQGIADEAQRTRLYHRMLGEWARRDAGAVKNWIANNQVPNSVANRFK